MDLEIFNVRASLNTSSERDILKENVGSQDQIAVAYGGLNKINFYPDGSFEVEPIIIKK